MKIPAELDDEAMRRIAARARQLMLERIGQVKGERWLRKNGRYLEPLTRAVWLATREELERDT